MSSEIITSLKQQRGFTIVELLVVIVIIGILAAITIVSYNGVTSRANTTAAQSAAQIVAQKAETFNAETSAYPYAFTDLTADGTKSYYVSSTAIVADPLTAQPASPSRIKFMKCGTTPNTTQALIASGTGNITGLRIYYWTYTGTPNANNYFTAGNDSGAGVLCPSS